MGEICIGRQKRPERVERLSRTPPGFGDPKEASMAVMGDSKKGRPGSKCSCCFETHGSRSGMVQFGQSSHLRQRRAREVRRKCVVALKNIGRFGRTNRRIEQRTKTKRWCGLDGRRSGLWLAGWLLSDTAMEDTSACRGVGEMACHVRVLRQALRFVRSCGSSGRWLQHY
jgi:hypothetical protein